LFRESKLETIESFFDVRGVLVTATPFTTSAHVTLLLTGMDFFGNSGVRVVGRFSSTVIAIMFVPNPLLLPLWRSK
jgi:dolichyl-phosphate-mannose--protein O-mannosyl transferase